jgi:hypothetical protein
MAKQRTVETTWEVWDYDVWGNEVDGYEVNDRFCVSRDYPLTLAVEVNNAGTPHEFESAYPTDKQLREALGIKPRAKVETDGDDITIYVTSADGYPLGELSCTSHESLSPIKRRS